MKKIILFAATMCCATILSMGQDMPNHEMGGRKMSQKAGMPSPPAETTAHIGASTITIKYSAPSVRGRKIFGGLVPYGQVWRAGANDATALHTDAALAFDGLTVPKGDYTLYVLPAEDGWKLIVNKQTGQWGTEYHEEQDLGRVNMKLTRASSPVETFKITLESSGGNKGALTMEWESTKATAPFTVK